MNTNKEAIIQVQNLTVAYGDAVIIDDISFDVLKGEVFVILGGSGCGKSTLLKQMIGLNKPAFGKILIGGNDIVSAEGDERLKILRKIGVMYQRGALFGSMTLSENVRVPLEEFTDLPPAATDLIVQMKPPRAFGSQKGMKMVILNSAVRRKLPTARSQRYFRRKLKLVGLHGFENHMPSELSGGMQKRAAIARAMVLDPLILFFDEPSAGLDPITSAELDQLILNIARNQKSTIVIVTHELPSIYTIADRVIMLDKRVKKIVAEGRPRDLRDHSDNPWVRQFFKREASSNISWKGIAHY